MKKSAPPLWLAVKQSKYLLLFILSVHVLTLPSIVFLTIALPFKLGLLLLVASSLYFHLQRYRLGYYEFTLKYTTEFAWQLCAEEITSIQILNSTVLTRFAIVLHLQIENKKRYLLVCCDAVSAEEYRQLIVALKIST